MFVAIRDVLVKSIGFNNVFEGLRWLGLNNIELAVNKEFKAVAFAYLDLSDKHNLDNLASRLKENNTKVCALLLENDFASEDIKREIEYVKKGIKIAEELNVKVVRINAVMKLRRNWTLERAVEVTVDVIKQILNHEDNIWLAIENHGVVSNRREFLRELFKRTEGLPVGLTLDTCNFYWYGYPLNEVYEIYEEFSKHVKHTHIKNATSIGPKGEYRNYGSVKMQPLYNGDIDLKKAIQILKDGGYDHDLTIEDESLGRYSIDERRKILIKDVQFLREVLKELR